MQLQGNEKQTSAWPRLAVFFTVAWIAALLVFSLFRGIPWLRLGDFDFATAMYYHGLMVPVLVLLYLLTADVLALNALSTWIYSAAAIGCVLLTGAGSIFNTTEGLSLASGIQLAGMALADLLGIALAAALVVLGLNHAETIRGAKAAFWLLLSSLVAILIAGAFGHLGAWGIDLGITSFPGVTTLLDRTGMEPEGFQEAVVSSHSHLVVVAVLYGLVALAVIRGAYHNLPLWKKRAVILGIWTAVASVLSAAAVYILSALAGWEPPTLFASGPDNVNGVPLDDVILAFGMAGCLICMGGLVGAPTQGPDRDASPFKPETRVAMLLVWVFGFASAVVLGVYIELHETFYGAGEPPASGALNDQAFVRAHMVYTFCLLPIIFSALLATECGGPAGTASRVGSAIFVWTSMLGMGVGLLGELLWVATLDARVLAVGMVVMGAALIAAAASLWPGMRPKVRRLQPS